MAGTLVLAVPLHVASPQRGMGFLRAWCLGSQRKQSKRTKHKLYHLLWTTLRSHKVLLPLWSQVCPDSKKGYIDLFSSWEECETHIARTVCRMGDLTVVIAEKSCHSCTAQNHRKKDFEFKHCTQSQAVVLQGSIRWFCLTISSHYLVIKWDPFTVGQPWLSIPAPPLSLYNLGKLD